MMVEILSGMCDDFFCGERVPVLDDGLEDDNFVIRSTADFDIAVLAVDLRAWVKADPEQGEEHFREAVRDAGLLYADVVFPGRRGWLDWSQAYALVEEGFAEWVAHRDEALELEQALENARPA